MDMQAARVFHLISAVDACARGCMCGDYCEVHMGCM